MYDLSDYLKLGHTVGGVPDYLKLGHTVGGVTRLFKMAKYVSSERKVLSYKKCLWLYILSIYILLTVLITVVLI